jgi:hypothetical protein
MTKETNMKTTSLKNQLTELAYQIETNMLSYDQFTRDAFWTIKNIDRELTIANCAVPDLLFGDFSNEDLSVELCNLLGVMHRHRECVTYVGLCKDIVDLTRHFYSHDKFKELEKRIKKEDGKVIFDAR